MALIVRTELPTRRPGENFNIASFEFFRAKFDQAVLALANRACCLLQLPSLPPSL
jgi:hypothetical protein